MIDPKDTTAGMVIIASQELAILLDKLRLELDTLISLYELDTDAINLVLAAHKAWRRFIKAELELVKYEWSGGTICPLLVNGRYQSLVLSRIKDLRDAIETKKKL